VSSILTTPCPRCYTVGTLTITHTLWALPLGTWSLAGAQPKTSARPRPQLGCSACDLRHLGEYDGQHAAFGPLEET
jgi:hypothetical protein